MRRRASICIDDDFAAGQPAISVRAADIELAGRINVPDRVLGNPAVRKRLPDVGLDDLLDVALTQVLVRMLMRQHDLGRGDRLALVITHGDLALRIGA